MQQLNLGVVVRTLARALTLTQTTSVQDPISFAFTAGTSVSYSFRGALVPMGSGGKGPLQYNPEGTYIADERLLVVEAPLKDMSGVSVLDAMSVPVIIRAVRTGYEGDVIQTAEGVSYQIAGIASEFSEMFDVAGYILKISSASQAAGIPA